jgi:hypothetical protein
VKILKNTPKLYCLGETEPQKQSARYFKELLISIISKASMSR